MKMSRSFALLCVAVLASVASAQLDLPLGADTTNMTYMGYNIVSNVTGYLYMSKDACEIEEVLLDDTPDFARARFIYTNGSNAPRGTVDRRNRTLAAWTMGDHATGNDYFRNGTALYGNPDWMNQYMVEATATAPADNRTRARAYAAVYTARVQLGLSYLMTELSGLAEEINPNGTTITASGAPHALEEGFGAYVGMEPSCAPWSVAEKAAPAFGTQATCTMSRVNQAIIAGFNTARDATLSGNVASYIAARDIIFSNVKAALIQGVIQYANETEVAHLMAARAATTSSIAAKAARKVAKNLGKSGNSGVTALRLKEAAEDAAAAAEEKLQNGLAVQAAQYTLYRALGPFIHMVDPATAQALNTHFSATKTIGRGHLTASVQALSALYARLGVTQEQVGTLGARSTLTCA